MLAAPLLILLAAPQSGQEGLAAAPLPPQVDAPFPTLEFPLLGSDRRASLADFRGRKVLLVQFASW